MSFSPGFRGYGQEVLSTMTYEEIQKRCKRTKDIKLKEDEIDEDLSFLDD